MSAIEEKLVRAKAGEVVFLNNSEHRAPYAHEMSVESYGKPRIFATLIYASTHKVEKALAAQGLEF